MAARLLPFGMSVLFLLAATEALPSATRAMSRNFWPGEVLPTMCILESDVTPSGALRQNVSGVVHHLSANAAPRVRHRQHRGKAFASAAMMARMDARAEESMTYLFRRAMSKKQWAEFDKTKLNGLVSTGTEELEKYAKKAMNDVADSLIARAKHEGVNLKDMMQRAEKRAKKRVLHAHNVKKQQQQQHRNTTHHGHHKKTVTIDTLLATFKTKYFTGEKDKWDQALIKQHTDLMYLTDKERERVVTELEDMHTIVSEDGSINEDFDTKGGILDDWKAEFVKYKTPSAFADQIAKCSKTNPALVNLVKKYDEISEDDKEQYSIINLLDEQHQAYVTSAFHYTMVLHALATAIGKSMPSTFYAEQLEEERKSFLHYVEKGIEAVRESDGGQGGDFSSVQESLFERAKVASVKIPGTKAYKDPGTSVVNGGVYGGWGLSINILEAMFQDWMIGLKDNAEAGYEMMLRPDGYLRDSEGKYPGKLELQDVDDEEEIPDFGKKHTGFLKIYPPLPTQWSHLYSTWNMAFVLSFPNYPFFLAKLFNVATICYQDFQGVCDNKGEKYLFNRIYTLYLHIHWELSQRMEGTSAPEAIRNINWKTKKLQKLWGTVNRAYGDDFKDAIHEALGGPEFDVMEGFKIHYDNIWKVFRPVVRGIFVLNKMMGESFSKMDTAFDNFWAGVEDRLFKPEKRKTKLMPENEGSGDLDDDPKIPFKPSKFDQKEEAEDDEDFLDWVKAKFSSLWD